MEKKELLDSALEIFDTRDMVKDLRHGMKEVIKPKCTSESLNAMCNAARCINETMRIHLDAARLSTKITRG